MVQLWHIVGTKFVGFVQHLGMPVRIKIHERRKGAFPKPPALNGGMRRAQNRARRDDHIAGNHRLFRVAHRNNFDSQLPTHFLRVANGAISVLIVRINFFQRE